MMRRRDPASRFRREVLSRGRFEHDWFTSRIPTLEPLVAALRGQRARVLELGAFEGLSACYLLWRLPDARITCVDTFDDCEGRTGYEERFDHNVALIDGSRVRKLKGATLSVLPGLVGNTERFHFVYVDASHRALDVLVDAALSWPMLRPGGVMVFDDYDLGSTDPMLVPTRAVEAFARVVASESELVPCGRQIALRRT
jgi:predicted O-methyltransferase YrrM